MALKTVLAISDTQAPFAHQDALDFIYECGKKYKPDVWVHQGDEIDAHGLSAKFFADPDGYSPGHEHFEALLWMKDLYQIVPKCKVCISNHTNRPLIKAKNAGIPQAFLRQYHEFMEAPVGWKWAQNWIIDDVLYEHGEGVSGQYAAVRAATKNRMSTSIGHIHTFGGVQWSGAIGGSIWGMNTGCLIDEEAYAFAYGKKLRDKPTLGMGLVKMGTPLFLPMHVDRRNRWRGTKWLP